MGATSSRLRNVYGTAAGLTSLLISLLLLGCTAGNAPPDESEAPLIRASRVFAGVDQHPPEDFAAYGILAFKSGVTTDSRERYRAICEGFLASIPAAGRLLMDGLSLDQQMATVWPLVSPELANELNEFVTGAELSDRCDEIVAEIDIVRSQRALEAARAAGLDADLDGAGPYLLAWSPSDGFGRSDVVVLRWDLSGIVGARGATEAFVAWRTEIQLVPELWSNGWEEENLAIVIARWADRFGAGVLLVFGLDVA